ncbi:MAG: hypothetical protein WC708_09940 [Lentisphaeria bacterium]
MHRIGLALWLVAGLAVLAAPSGERLFHADFRGRQPVKLEDSGFSSCLVNDQGAAMAMDLAGPAGGVRLHGDNPAVSGAISRRFSGPAPTAVGVTLQRLRPAEGGWVYLQAADLISGAAVTVTSLNGTDDPQGWVIDGNEGGDTPGRTERLGALGVDWRKPVTLAIAQVGPGIFQVSINGRDAGAPVSVKNLHQLTVMQVGVTARKNGLTVLDATAWRQATVADPEPSVKSYAVAAKPRGTAFTAANPYGNAENIDYPHHGFSDAMADPELFGELAATLRELNLKLLRFPGGSSAYTYSIHGPESMPAYLPLNYACGPAFRWADSRQYFKLCKAVGADALYQLNMGNYYDPKDKKVYAIGPVDGPQFLAGADGVAKPVAKQDNYRPDKLAAAVAEAKTIAGWAKAAGVKVIWEFGNEDYCYYSPATFVRLCKAFQDGIRQVDPQTPFVICGDGISWSDWRWPFALFAEAKKRQLDLAYTAQHVYLFGGARRPFTDGQATYDGVLQGWRNLRFLHQGVRGKLDEAGYAQVKVAITEGGIAAGGPLAGAPQEHGMGRSLAEAAIYPARIQQYAMLVHHDLVRNDSPEKAGTWFCRIFYRPDNPKGKRYELPLDALVMKETGRHGLREIIFDSGDGTTVSQWSDGLLVTSGNPYPLARRVRLTLDGFTPTQTRLTATGWQSPDLTVMAHTPITLPVTVTPATAGSPAQVEFTLPPYSFGHFQIR